MSYVQRLLIPDEVVLHQARRSIYPTFAGPVLANVAALAATAALALLVPGALLVAWALPVLPLAWLAWRYLYWANKFYLVTNHRVLKLEGVFTKDHSDASLDKINDMTLRQGLLARLLDYGDLAIATANEDLTVTYHFLDRPVEFKRQTLMSRETASPGNEPSAAAEDDPIARLERLGTLRERGVVTEEEFQAAKAHLLGRMR